ncbi:MAG TPA: hypothetical protein VJV22_08755 [Acidobacteriaceae bacterium]|nr:hypothetical protein [Acidobacteriaceae bacterium]
MRNKGKGFGLYWLDETDWLVDIVAMTRSDAEGNAESLDYIGRLSAFAAATDTRLLAQIGAPEGPTYELWFSFSSDGQKQKFLKMVRDDGYADPADEDCFFAPANLEDLPRLRPIIQVFPKEQSDRIIEIATVTSASMALAKHFVN